MPSFLVFRLWGPMASWGDIAVGERRPGLAHPTKSAALGLVAAALGLKREAPELAALGSSLGFASRIDTPGSLLSDYHTAQEPPGPAVRKKPPQSRRDELAFPRESLHTTLSRRDYQCDALAVVCLWLLGGPKPFGLEQLSKALGHPRFVPYLGRKSCPLGLPIEPQIVEAANPAEAMDAAVFHGAELLEALPMPELRAYRWEGDWPGLRPEQTVTLRDQGGSRAAWQFLERNEHVAQRRRSHVSEQD
jgi:CRISPR system Cascade subunit CasD